MMHQEEDPRAKMKQHSKSRGSLTKLEETVSKLAERKGMRNKASREGSVEKERSEEPPREEEPPKEEAAPPPPDDKTDDKLPEEESA